MPSKFVGTQTWFDPTQFGGGTNHTFHPPFNHVSNFRDPGRINVNTIFDPSDGNGIMDVTMGRNHGYAVAGIRRWPGDIVQSRRGQPAGDSDQPSTQRSAIRRLPHDLRQAVPLVWRKYAGAAAEYAQSRPDKRSTRRCCGLCRQRRCSRCSNSRPHRSLRRRPTTIPTATPTSATRT